MHSSLRHLAPTASLATVLAFASASTAETLTSSADIEVRTALSISETQSLNFGKIEKPTSQVTATVSTAGASSGTATYIDTTDVAPGIFLITGSASETINISVTDLQNVAGFEFTNVKGNYGSTTNGNLLTGITGQDAPGAGENLTIGATMTIESFVTEGDYTPGFQVEVNYD